MLYQRAEDGQLFAGAADDKVREQAREDAQVNVSARINEVKAGGEVLGAEVGTMLDGKLSARISVAGAIYGTVVVATLDEISGGKAELSAEADTVGEGGRLVVAKILKLGGGSTDVKMDVDQVSGTAIGAHIGSLGKWEASS